MSIPAKTIWKPFEFYAKFSDLIIDIYILFSHYCPNAGQRPPVDLRNPNMDRKQKF